MNKAPHLNGNEDLPKLAIVEGRANSLAASFEDQFLRVDIPKDDVHEVFVKPKDGVNYYMATSYQYQDPGTGQGPQKLIDKAVGRK